MEAAFAAGPAVHEYALALALAGEEGFQGERALAGLRATFISLQRAPAEGETAALAANVQSKVKTMIGVYATQFGPYPFVDEKYGHAEFVFGGGMEHQTCSSMGSFSEFVVAHELGHQWWGDMITCRDFHHIWLNEGFATYTEAIWAESQGGLAAYKADLAQNKFFGPGSVWVPDDTDEARIFSSDLSYDKGSWVLHMLRSHFGDDLFRRAVKTYLERHSLSTVTTDDLRQVFEEVSGQPLDRFFDQWLYHGGAPELKVTYEWLAKERLARVTVAQTQPVVAPPVMSRRWTPRLRRMRCSGV